MIWSDFKDEVRVMLTVDAQRKGAGVQSYIDSVILSGVIELQQYIPTLRTLNRNTYRHGRLTRDKVGALTGVQRGRLDSRGKITKATIMKPSGSSTVAVEINRWPWDKRNSLGMDCLANCRSPRHPGKIMMQPGKRDFYLYPDVAQDELLILDWDGVKTSFKDTDDTPYDHRMVKTVSDYAKAHVVREVDKDLKLYQEYWGMYIKERANLFLDEKDSTLFDIPSITKDHYARCCLPDGDALPVIEPPIRPLNLTALAKPNGQPVGLSAAVYASAPESLSIPNGYVDAYGVFRVDDFHSVSAPPTDLEAAYAPLAPEALNAGEGFSAAPEDLTADAPPARPIGLAYYVHFTPKAPMFLYAFPGLPNAPQNLDTLPAHPLNLFAVDEALLPINPEDLEVLVSPTDLTADQSNASGTVIVATAPEDLSGMHDGAGGTWYPTAPQALLAQVIGVEPLAPTELNATEMTYVIIQYTYINGTWTLVGQTGFNYGTDETVVYVELA